MNTRLQYFLDQLRSNYWFIPGVMLVLSIVLSLVMVEVDNRIRFDLIADFGWLYLGGAEGARTVLSTIASSTVTVAGVVFSIVIVALSNASTQFGPRLLINFMRDRSNQFVLGIFLGTFIYCLLILRTVRTGENGSSEVIPYLSVTLGIALALASILSFVYFVHHVSASINANRVIDIVGDDLDRAIDRLYPTDERKGRIERQLRSEEDIPDDLDDNLEVVHSEDNGYLQAIDYDSLISIAKENDAVLRISCRPGVFVKHDAEIGKYYPGPQLNEDIEERIRNQYILGSQRVGQQDIEFAIEQLVELALRALSPSLNDPFTAMACIDRLGSALATLSERKIPSGYRYDDDGRLRLITRQVTFSGLLDDAFNQLRQNSRGNVAVTIRLLEALAVVAGETDNDANAEHVWRHVKMVYRSAMESIPEPNDREDVEFRFRIVQRILDLEDHDEKQETLAEKL